MSGSLLGRQASDQARIWTMGNRIIVTLECRECKNRNYTTTKNKRTTPDKLEFSKYCRFCRKHIPHRETK